MIFGYESVDTLQDLLWETSTAPDTMMIGACGLSRLISITTSFPFISGHEIVDDYNVNGMDGSQFQSFAAARQLGD